jgi:translocator protein
MEQTKQYLTKFSLSSFLTIKSLSSPPKIPSKHIPTSIRRLHRPYHQFTSSTHCIKELMMNTQNPSSTNSLLRPILTALAVIITLTTNTLAVVLPLNNRSTEAISDSFKVFFTPAGYVFSIWGVIYTALIAFTVYSFLPRNRTNPTFQAIFPWFILSCAMNSAWIFLWHYGFYPLTMLVMLVLLASLVMVYVRLGVGKTHYSGGDFWCVRFTFSVYLGWICVATIANATALLYDVQWSGFGINAEVWTAIMLGVAVALGAIITETRRDALLVAVFLWAFVGIALKHSAVAMVGTSAWAAVVMAGALVLRGFWVSQQRMHTA